MENQQSNKRRITLKKKLILIILPLIMASLLLACMVFYSIARQTIQAKVSGYMQQYLVQLTLSIDNELDTSIRMNAQLTVNEQIIDTLKNYEQSDNLMKTSYREKMSDIFISLISIYDNIKGIYVFDNHGNEFYAKKRYGQNILEMRQMDWYEDTLKNSGGYVIFLDEKSGADTRSSDLTIGIARSVVDIYTHESYGVVLIEIPYSILEDGVFGDNRQLNLDQGDIYIQDVDGTLIYTTDVENQFWDDAEKTALSSEECQVQIKMVDGEEIIQISYKSPKSHWGYTYLCEMKYLMQDMEKMKHMLVVFMICIGLVAGSIVILFSNIFLRPVKKLVAGMEKVTNGDYDVSVQANTQDEFQYLILTFNNMARSIRELIEKVYQAELIQKEAQLEVLQQQINPHFLYNTLESMRGLALEEKCVKVADMAKNMSYFMRYNMNRGKSQAVLEEELRHVTYYLRIINYRFDNKISLKIRLPEGMMRLSVPKFTLQPVVENAVLHGLSEKREDCVIILNGYIKGEDAVVEVIDNGIGISEASLYQINENLKKPIETGQKQPRMRSVGVYNVNSRLKLNYSDRYGVTISSEIGEGTVVTIMFPAKKGG